jgi:hypothetical protein
MEINKKYFKKAAIKFCEKTQQTGKATMSRRKHVT